MGLLGALTEELLNQTQLQILAKSSRTCRLVTTYAPMVNDFVPTGLA